MTFRTINQGMIRHLVFVGRWAEGTVILGPVKYGLVLSYLVILDWLLIGESRLLKFLQYIEYFFPSDGKNCS